MKGVCRCCLLLSFLLFDYRAGEVYLIREELSSCGILIVRGSGRGRLVTIGRGELGLSTQYQIRGSILGNKHL